MRRIGARLALLPLTLYLGGCAVGYNSTLFVTKSNIGIDVDTKPPTVEISIARREGVIAPAFEGGRTPPVLASFGADINPFSRFFFGVQSTFAGGDAAMALAQEPGETNARQTSALCLSQPPEPKEIWGRDVSVPGKGQVRPFTFITDATLGLKLAWSGTAGQFPDTVQLGFNRKEFAWAPVLGTDQVDCVLPGTQQKGTYAVHMPAFLAVLDNNVETGALAETGVQWRQFFATGEAATTLARHEAVRQAMLERMTPEVHQGTIATDPAVSCLQQWLTAGDREQQKARRRDLQHWWTQERQLGGFGTLLIKTVEFTEQRTAFMKDRNIACRS